MRNKFKFRKILNKKGFTLLECLISIAIIGIMCSSLMALFNQGIVYVKKSVELDSNSSTAQQLVLSKNDNYYNADKGESFYKEVPVKIQFTIYYGESEVRQLEEISYNFQVGISQTKVGNKLSVKVVYFDMMQSELEGLDYD